MKKYRKFLAALCTVCMILAIPISVLAAETTHNKPYNNTAFTIGSDTKSYSLDVTTDEPCIRVWGCNTDSEGSITVQLVNENGTSKGSTVELGAGESEYFDVSFNDSSDSTWNIEVIKKSGDVSKVTGMFAVRMESDWTKFN